jgi:nicotinic acid mononucleotide adenylyltransferase
MKLGEQFGISKEFVSSIEYCLNLIEKQQKEIKELTKTCDLYKNASDHIAEIFLEATKPNYISKDKIREKIKKAKEINWHTPKLVIEYFEELLEEN